MFPKCHYLHNSFLFHTIPEQLSATGVSPFLYCPMRTLSTLMHTYAHTCTHMHTHTDTHTYTHTHTHTHLALCLYFRNIPIMRPVQDQNRVDIHFAYFCIVFYAFCCPDRNYPCKYIPIFSHILYFLLPTIQFSNLSHFHSWMFVI